MSKQPFLTIDVLLKQARTTLSWPVLSVLAILVLVPAVALAASAPLSPWSEQLPGAGRFQVLPAFQQAAVLDKETGLVWEKSPGDTDGNGVVDSNDAFTWDLARAHCANKNVGGRKGWRLPAFDELASLVDPANSNPALPTGNPFTNVQSSGYWSATTDAGNPANAWHVRFDIGNLNTILKTITVFVWCVRGDMNADQY